jgi:hypothetical protein
MAKKKQKMEPKVEPMPYEQVLKVVQYNPLQFNPARVGDINGLMFTVTTDTSGEREPFVQACIELPKDKLDELYDIVHKRAPEYNELQRRHEGDIRKLKDRLANLWRNGCNALRPGGIHVVSENPTMYRLTLFTGEEHPIFAHAATEDVLVNTIRKGEFNANDEPYEGSYTELDDDDSAPTCPVCGSPWQLIGHLPVMHCCRCDSNWTQFARKVISATDILNPGDLSMDSMGTLVGDYLTSDYSPSNPKLVGNIVQMVHDVPGKKVVELHFAQNADGDNRDEIAFQCYEGVPAEMRHFVECVDVALGKCGVHEDKFRPNNRKDAQNLIVTISVPDSEDVDLDSFDKLLYTDEQPPAKLYSFIVMHGIMMAMPMEMQHAPLPNMECRDIAELIPSLKKPRMLFDLEEMKTGSSVESRPDHSVIN